MCLRDDFLTVSPGDFDIVRPLTIGFNPPFGYQSRLACKFIKRVHELWKPEQAIFLLPTTPRCLDVLHQLYTATHSERTRATTRLVRACRGVGL